MAEEIVLAEQQLDVVKRRQEVGRAETEEVLKASREVLALKRQLAESPEDAAHVDDFDYGSNSSETLNGQDKDATRRRDEETTEE